MKYNTGRRKSSSSRVFIKKGDGKIIINNIKINKYFFTKKLKLIIFQPFSVINDKNCTIKNFDFYITVKGGGIYAQAVSIRHAISKFLLSLNIEYRKKLRMWGFITRDSREVERKKYGFRKSRCKHQFSKR